MHDNAALRPLRDHALGQVDRAGVAPATLPAMSVLELNQWSSSAIAAPDTQVLGALFSLSLPVQCDGEGNRTLEPRRITCPRNCSQPIHRQVEMLGIEPRLLGV